jgi:hypothetical protein
MIARHFDIPVAHDGDVATQVREALLLSSHFDGQTRVTCGILPQHWTTFLRAYNELLFWVNLPPRLGTAVELRLTCSRDTHGIPPPA